MVLAPNTSVGQRTLSEWDITTAVTIKCVTLFDVDFSNQFALSYGLPAPPRWPKIVRLSLYLYKGRYFICWPNTKVMKKYL